MDKKQKWYQTIDNWTFWPPLVFTILICVWVISSPDTAGVVLEAGFAFVTEQFAWLFEWYSVAVLGILVYICCAPIGKKRLGTEKPEFSTKSWLGMMFCTSAGLGLLTWGTIEWFYYADAPMWGMETGAPETINLASAIPLYHWGPVALVSYTLMGVTFAYLMFVKKASDTRPSSACETLLGKKMTDGVVGKIINILFTISLLCSVVTCVGVNVPTVFGLVTSMTGFEPSFAVKMLLILSWSVIMAVLLSTGLKKGVKMLADVRVIVGFALMLFILIFSGYTFDILNGFTDSLGALVHYFGRLSFNTDVYANSMTPQWWTIFYYAWNFSMAIANGIFFAKISRGRTLKSLIIGSIAAQALGAYVFFMVLTQFAIITTQKQGLDLGAIIAESGQGMAIVTIWEYLPFAKILMPILLFFAYACMQTLLNSNAVSISLATTKVLRADEEAPVWNRVFWSLCIGGIAISLLLIGGIRPFQTIAVMAGVPSGLIIALVFASFIKDVLKNEKIAKERGIVVPEDEFYVAELDEVYQN